MGSCSFRRLEGGGIELLVDFGVERVPGSWLEEIENPVMLVTGAAGFIGRYMVELLTSLGYRVFAADIGRRPAYLGQSKFRDVAYASADLREEDEVVALVRRARPAVVFHIGAVFDFSAPADLLWEVNVTGAERVCEAARDAGARRLVYWSSGSIYAPSEESADESAPKEPADPYAASKLKGELAVFEYHEPGRFEVYSVRPAMVSGVLSRYGSGLVMRLIYEGFLVGAPQRRGITTAIVNARDVATCGYLIAAFNPSAEGLECAAVSSGQRRVSDRASSDETAFNAAADPIGVDSMMRELGGKVPRRHIFGVKTKLAEIIGFGFQERIRLPDKAVELVAQGSALATAALNRVRPAKLFPKIPPETVPYLTQPHPMSNAKAREILGWRPDPPAADFDEVLRFYEQTGWTGFERRAASEAEPELSTFGEVEGLVKALRSPGEPEGGPHASPRVSVPSLGLEIDPWSLKALVRSAESHLLERAYRGRLADVLGGTIPRLVSHAASDVFSYLKSAYLRRWGRGGLPEFEALALAREGLKLDRDAVVFWVVAANIARVIGEMRRARGQLRRLARLLPEGTYGLLIETVYGDVAAEYRGPVGSTTLSGRRGVPGEQGVHFPREEVDTIPRHLPLRERTERFRKLRGLRLALGIRFSDLVEIFSGAASVKDFERAICSSPSELIGRLAAKVEGSGWTLLLLEDHRGRFGTGIRLSGAASFLSPERLKAYRRARGLLSVHGDEGAFEESLARASSGREKVKVYPAADFRKLLADAMTTGIVSRLFGR